MRKCSYWPWIGSLFVISLSTYSRQALETLESATSADVVWILLTPGVLGIFYLCLTLARRSLGIGVRLALLSLLGTFCVFWYTLEIIEERAHLVLYALVGSTWTFHMGKTVVWGAWLGVWGGVGTAFLDETLQFFLPYRVGDVRDLGLDLVGVLVGVGFSSILRVRDS